MRNATTSSTMMRNNRKQSALFFVWFCLFSAAPTLSFHVPTSLGQPRRRSSLASDHTTSSSSLRSSRVEEADSRTWNQTPSRGRLSLEPLQHTSSASSRTPTHTSRQRRKTKPLPVTGYDSTAIEELYDRRPLQVGWRLNSLGFPLLGKCQMYCRDQHLFFP